MGQRKQTAAGKKRQLQRNRTRFKKESAELKAKLAKGELDTSADGLAEMSNSKAKRATTNASRLTSTLAKKRFVEQVYENVDRLFAAQLTLALGSVKLFKTEVFKNGRRETTVITDTYEIIGYLNDPEHYGQDGKNEIFYLISDKDPENKALDSLLNRAMGAPKQELQLSDESGIFLKDRLKIEVVPSVDLDIQEGEVVEQTESTPEPIDVEAEVVPIPLEESNKLSRKITLETQPNSDVTSAPIHEHPTQSSSVGIKMTRL